MWSDLCGQDVHEINVWQKCEEGRVGDPMRSFFSEGGKSIEKPYEKIYIWIVFNRRGRIGAMSSQVLQYIRGISAILFMASTCFISVGDDNHNILYSSM